MVAIALERESMLRIQTEEVAGMWVAQERLS